jgi:hypothetical protein
VSLQRGDGGLVGLGHREPQAGLEHGGEQRRALFGVRREDRPRRPRRAEGDR